MRKLPHIFLHLFNLWFLVWLGLLPGVTPEPGDEEWELEERLEVEEPDEESHSGGSPPLAPLAAACSPPALTFSCDPRPLVGSQVVCVHPCGAACAILPGGSSERGPPVS
jgi:hypothetical protein